MSETKCTCGVFYNVVNVRMDHLKSCPMYDQPVMSETKIPDDLTELLSKELREENASLRAEVESLKARVEQRDSQINAFNSGGFADADAMAEKYLDLRDQLAEAKTQCDSLQQIVDAYAAKE